MEKVQARQLAETVAWGRIAIDLATRPLDPVEEADAALHEEPESGGSVS